MRDDDEMPEDEFPHDHGTADTEATVHCPHCAAVNEIELDPGSGARQDYVEDCRVCCRPWRVRVQYDGAGAAEVWVEEE